MKTLKTVIGTFLMVAFLASLAGCDKLGSLGKSDQSGHGHSHE
jgi:predicted small lipoprotein YifL